jgi:asparagine synthase (glutamine-hydrolysing)
MLKARIRLPDLCAPARCSGGSIVFGESHVTPYGHRLLATKFLKCATFNTVLIYERLVDEDETSDIQQENGGFDTPDDLLAALASHPLDWLCIFLLENTVEFRCAYQGTAPIYASFDGDIVSASWDIADLIASNSVNLSKTNLARFVTQRWPYTCETMLSGVYRLTSETGFRITREGLRYEYPRPTPSIQTHALASGSDPIELFSDAVCAVIALRPLDPAKTALELSGGMDSGITTLAAARVLGPHLVSYGAEFEGEMGQAQRLRRELIRDAAKTRDISLPAENFGSYDLTSPRRSVFGVWPEDDSYPELFSAFSRLISTAGIDTVVSGLGGDELYPIFGHEDAHNGRSGDTVLNAFATEDCMRIAESSYDAHPQSWLLASCWQTSAGRARGFLKAGLWPVYPFFSREITHFTFNLPIELRRNRNLHRRVLTKLLADNTFEQNYLKESFQSVLRSGLIRNSAYVDELARNSILGKLGFIDAEKLCAFLGNRIPDDVIQLSSAFYPLNFECFFKGCDLSTSPR